MNNERFLFKAKRLDNREWIKGDLCKFMNGKPCIMPESYFATRHFNDDDKLEDGFAIGAFYPVIPETVGQSCDYYDDEGDLVFENDKIRVVHFLDKYEGHVYWSDRDLAFKIKTDEGKSFMLSSISSGLVIGNIHDNE